MSNGVWGNWRLIGDSLVYDANGKNLNIPISQITTVQGQAAWAKVVHAVTNNAEDELDLLLAEHELGLVVPATREHRKKIMANMAGVPEIRFEETNEWR
jgi:hypothetical protein